MLMILVYLFAVLGVSLLLLAAVLQYRLSRPRAAGHSGATHALSAFSLKFPQRFITPDESHLIALDEEGQALAIGLLHPGKPEPATATLYTFDAILGAEIVENALTLSKVSKTSRITTSAPRTRAGTAVSYEFTEPVQGGSPAEEIRELTLRIYFSSADTPVVSIPFLPPRLPARKTDLQYSAAFLEAQQVHERIRDIVSA
ncbi:hypothetical protein [Paenibacillus sp. FSL P2-0136]|uniref:hypothetical protein n=1 Tax=Paenibacillus sp. FSL P2-0136 TaxID=2975317 RepID=UPI0030D99C57